MMQVIYLVKAWRISRGRRYARRAGEEERVFASRKRAETWLIDNLFLKDHSEGEPEKDGRDLWHHRDSTPDSFVYGEIRELLLGDEEESKFYYLKDFF